LGGINTFDAGEGLNADARLIVGSAKERAPESTFVARTFVGRGGIGVVGVGGG